MQRLRNGRTSHSFDIPRYLLRTFRKASAINTERGYSTVFSNESDEVKVKVKVGLKGFVPLSIRHPPNPTPDGPIILFLRHGVPDAFHVPKPESTSSLALGSNATVVRLEYRLSDQYPYPTPIHDVLAGYKWVQKHLACRTQTSNGLYETSKYAKLGICGELLGGSLATMLALTECHVGRPGISGAAMGNPIVDWTSLFPAAEETETDFANPSKARFSANSIAGNPSQAQPNGSMSVETLVALRSTLFGKPETFFDPFASPLLFFRTPGYDLPPDPSAYAGLRLNASDDDPEPHDPSLHAVKKRRSHRKYPPPSSSLSLPKMRVEVGKDNALRAQGLELVELARRSVGLWEEGGKDSVWKEDGTTKIGAGVGEGRIEVVEREESGLWGERELAELGHWFGEVLRRP